MSTPTPRRALDLDTWGPSTRRGRALIAATLVPGAVVVITTLAGSSIAEGMDLCPWHATTGLWCPFCGGTRATAALLRGGLTTAVGYNPFALVLDLWLATVLARYARRWWRRLRGEDVTGAPVERTEALTVLVLAAVFGVVRNLPGAWTYLGPLLGPAG